MYAPCFLTFCSSDQSLLLFKFKIFVLNIYIYIYTAVSNRLSDIAIGLRI